MGHITKPVAVKTEDGYEKTNNPDREADDFYPTPPEATRALLAAEWGALADYPVIWEPACGDGAMAREIAATGHSVIATDMVDRGYSLDAQRSFYDFTTPLAGAIITNPPYCEINARDGHGRWLRHTMDLGVGYCAMLLNWDWPAARKNGLDELMARHPISRVYLCRWKIDFTGGGAPPQRNAWFVWDKTWQGETVLRFLDRDGDARQGVMI